MDYQKICPGCMKERSDPAGPCEFCGYDPALWGPEGDSLAPGTLLAGRYLTGRILGRGGFGITYLGLDLQLQIRVAVKELFLKAVSLRDRESGRVLAAGGKESLFASCRGRFLREARILAMLDEKDAEGIVTVRDYFEENGTAYIVMEYIEGMTLRDKIGREGRMDYRQMMACVRPFCRAVMKIHSFNVVHKDISPENIMITQEGRVRLLDFGVACGPDPDPAGDPVSYKQGFAAPEQYSRGGSIRPATDVYAAAAVVYYCLTGHRPAAAPERQMGQSLRPLREWGCRIPKGAERAIGRAMSLAFCCRLPPSSWSCCWQRPGSDPEYCKYLIFGRHDRRRKHRKRRIPAPDGLSLGRNRTEQQPGWKIFLPVQQGQREQRRPGQAGPSRRKTPETYQLLDRRSWKACPSVILPGQ